MNSFLRTAVMVVFLFPSLAENLDAQDTSDLEDRATSRRFSFTLDLGGTVGGPAGSLAGQLRDAGYSDTSPEGCFFGLWCTGPTSHPTRDHPEGYVGVSARYALTSSLALGAGFGNSSLGGSTGFRKHVPGSESGDYVHSHWDMSMLRAETYWTPTATLRLGGGPALYWLNGPMYDQGPSLTRIGATAEVGAALPVHTRFFLNLGTRLNFVPSRDIAHRVHGLGDEVLSLRPNWTHVTIALGVGARF